MANEFREAAEAMIVREIELGPAENISMTDLVARAMELAAEETYKAVYEVFDITDRTIYPHHLKPVAARVKGRIENEKV